MPSPRSLLGTTAANCSHSTCSPSPMHMLHPRVTAVMIAPTASGECLMIRAASSRAAGSNISVRHHAIDEADLQRPLRRERIARQQQFQRALAPGEARQPLGAAEGRRHAEIDFRLGEPRALAGDGQMHGFGDLAPAAEGQSVDRSDHGLLEGFEPRGHGLPPPGEVPHGGVRTLANAHGKFVDVGTGGKSAFTRAGPVTARTLSFVSIASSTSIRRSISA